MVIVVLIGCGTAEAVTKKKAAASPAPASRQPAAPPKPGARACRS